MYIIKSITKKSIDILLAIYAVYYLVRQELPFGGHLAKTELGNRENYLKDLHHRAQQNEKLQTHFENSVVFNVCQMSLKSALLLHCPGIFLT
jgi:hypothetical protein